MNGNLPKSKDALTYYKWIAFGAMGIYLFKLSRNQGSSLFGGEPVSIGNTKISMNTDKIVDTVSPWIQLNPMQKEMVTTALKEFLKGLKNE